MTIGERGPTGNDGKSGERGVEGRTGERGSEGRRGTTGKTGQTGEKGEPTLSRSQTISMFLFVVAAFILLAWRTEINADRIGNNTRLICESVNMSGTNANTVIDTNRIVIAKIEGFTGAEKKSLIDNYRNAKTEPAPCP